MKVKDYSNRKYTTISAYVIAVAAIIIIIYNVVDSVPFYFSLIMEKIEWLMNAAEPIILALVFTYLLDPIADTFEGLLSRSKHFKDNYKKTRLLSVAIVMIIVVAVITGICSLIVYSITDQLRLAKLDDIYVFAQNIANSINDIYNNAVSKLSHLNIQSEEINEYITKFGKSALEKVADGSTAMLSSISSLTGFIGKLFLAIMMTIYFLLDENLIKATIKKISTALFSKKTNDRMSAFIVEADTVFSGYIRGQFMDAIFMFVAISVILSIMGVKFSLLIGICSGIANMIPYCGPFVAYGSVILVCGFSGKIKLMIIALVALIILQTIDGNVIGPKLLSNSVQVHPLLVVISLVIGGAIGGLLGMVLAVPVGALCKVLFMKYIDKKYEERIVKEGPQNIEDSIDNSSENDKEKEGNSND